jgi:hypothetical protein
VTVNLELQGRLGARRVQQNVGKLKITLVRSAVSVRRRNYQEKHPLLVTLLGMFEEAAVPQEFPAGLDQIVETHEIPLEFAQCCQILRMLQSLADGLHQVFQGVASCQTIGSIGVAGAVKPQESFEHEQNQGQDKSLTTSTLTL